MRALLMYRDRDLELEPGPKLPWSESALTQDLELNTLLRAMANNDRFLYEVARAVVLLGFGNNLDTVLYRQAVLRDCLENPAVVRRLYDITVDTLETQRHRWLGIFSHYPSGILSESITLMEMLIGKLKEIREIARTQGSDFRSEGFSNLFSMIEAELSDEYLSSIQDHLSELRFGGGILMSAKLGQGNAAHDYVLHRTGKKGATWFSRQLNRGTSVMSFRLHPRDEGGSRILSDIRNSGINPVANALAQSAEHVNSFFSLLRNELAFYMGCLNLHDRLASKGELMCFPRPLAAGTRGQRSSGLYDPCLSLLMEDRAVGNSIDADGKSLVIITGANQGGKSVFLRGIGLAQVMMQCGMFVAAESLEAELCAGLFTHYRREEDATMKSGKLDEELARMSAIVDHLVPDSMLLCNESFAATNDREGSEIARQIVTALVEKRIKVFFVTHLYELAHSISDSATLSEDTLFLRAERLPDGTRTFRLVVSRPLETSYGEDLYHEVFPAAGN